LSTPLRRIVILLYTDCLDGKTNAVVARHVSLAQIICKIPSMTIYS